MAAACSNFWFDTDNEQLEREMRFNTGLDGKRFREVCIDQRFPNCGPRTTGGPRVLPLWSS
jgi:hypothetical protein